MPFQKARKTHLDLLLWHCLVVTVGEEGMEVPGGRQVTGTQTPVQERLK